MDFPTFSSSTSTGLLRSLVSCTTFSKEPPYTGSTYARNSTKRQGQHRRTYPTHAHTYLPCLLRCTQGKSDTKTPSTPQPLLLSLFHLPPDSSSRWHLALTTHLLTVLHPRSVTSRTALLPLSIAHCPGLFQTLFFPGYRKALNPKHGRQWGGAPVGVSDPDQKLISSQKPLYSCRARLLERNRNFSKAPSSASIRRLYRRWPLIRHDGTSRSRIPRRGRIFATCFVEL